MYATSKKPVKIELELDNVKKVTGEGYLFSNYYEYELEEYEYSEAGYTYEITDAEITGVLEDSVVIDEEFEKDWENAVTITDFKILDNEADIEWETDDDLLEYSIDMFDDED